MHFRHFQTVFNIYNSLLSMTKVLQLLQHVICLETYGLSVQVSLPD